MTVKPLTQVEIVLLQSFEASLELLEAAAAEPIFSFSDEMKQAAARALAGLKRREGESDAVWAARLAQEASEADD
jgi:hypothetical protein